MDADYSFYVKTIETNVRAFLPLNISAIGTVSSKKPNFSLFMLVSLQKYTVGHYLLSKNQENYVIYKFDKALHTFR